jgi:hypothetical protein
VKSNSGKIKSRELGTILKTSYIGQNNALMFLRDRHASLRNFLEQYQNVFLLSPTRSDIDFYISLKENQKERAKSLESLEALTVSQLKEKLKSLGLKVSGSKSELVERLKEETTARSTASELSSLSDKSGIGMSPTDSDDDEFFLQTISDYITGKVIQIAINYSNFI